MITAKALGIAAVLACMILLVCGFTIALPLLEATRANAACRAPASPVPTSTAATAEWTSVQRAHAATIVAAGKQRGIPPRGWVIALAVAMQESGLLNLANSAVPRSMTLPHDAVGHDHDSVGLFQQRASPPEGQGGWGTADELLTPRFAADKFYTALLKVEGWQQKRLTEVAQAVQRSATPEAYQRWERKAEALAALSAGVADIGQIEGGPPHAPCGPDSFQEAIVSAQGWVQPVDAPIGDRFGAPRPGGRLHAGVDLIAARGTPVRAAAAGTVTRVRCQSSTGTCDSDGSSHASGCGWYAEITHATEVTYNGVSVTRVVTRYCHMLDQPAVAIGQAVEAGKVIGYIGSSGGSSGPHLHWEVHINPGNSVDVSNAVDPALWMLFRGVRFPVT